MAGKIFKFLPKPSSFSIPNHHHHNNNNNKYMFSGPIVPISMIPDHCRRKSNEMLEEEEEEEEPTSPKVSCLGQVGSHKKTNSRKKKKASTLVIKKEEEQKKKKKKKKKKEAPKRTSSLGRLLWGKVTPARRGVDSSSSEDEVVVVARPDVRKYASGRGTLKDFDWRTMTGQNVGNKAEAAEEEAHSAPILVIGGAAAVALEPKKEINIWMRRARAPPIPLQLN